MLFRSGKADNRYQEDEEDIQVRLLGKEEVRRVAREENVTARALYAIMIFLMTEEENPYRVFIEERTENDDSVL